MLKKKFFIKGQSLVEIVTVFAIASLAILAMQAYVKRGIQGRTKDLTDRIINPEDKALRYTTADEAESLSTTDFSGNTTVSMVKGGGVNKVIREKTYSTSKSLSKNKP